MENEILYLTTMLQAAAEAAKDQAPEKCPYRKVQRLKTGFFTPAEETYFKIEEDLRKALLKKPPQ